MNKEVTVITLQNVRNYGSVLQALATQEVFKKLGCDVDFINYQKPGVATPVQRIARWTKGMNLVKKYVYFFILYPSFIRQEKIFNSFINKWLNQQEKEYSTEEDFRNFPIKSDIYITGSDQTWNSNWNNGILGPLFLSFVPDNVKKISYSASIGKEQLDESEVEQTFNYLKRYDAISVRETSAVKIVEKQLGLSSPTQVLDPTLQVSKDFWLSFLKNKKIKGTENDKYVLIYQLNTNPKFDTYAKEFAKRKGWKLVRLCTRYDQAIKCGKAAMVPQVEDFISLIANAGCVITDSFHATAFCCNLNVPMIIIFPNEFSSRLASILKQFDLENRHLTDYNDFSFIDNTSVDFTYVNEVLEQKRKVGLDFLKRSISN